MLQKLCSFDSRHVSVEDNCVPLIECAQKTFKFEKFPSEIIEDEEIDKLNDLERMVNKCCEIRQRKMDIKKIRRGKKNSNKYLLFVLKKC